MSDTTTVQDYRFHAIRLAVESGERFFDLAKTPEGMTPEEAADANTARVLRRAQAFYEFAQAAAAPTAPAGTSDGMMPSGLVTTWGGQ